MEAVCARCAHTRACPLHRDSVHATRHKRADGCVRMPRLPQADIPFDTAHGYCKIVDDEWRKRYRQEIEDLS